MSARPRPRRSQRGGSDPAASGRPRRLAFAVLGDPVPQGSKRIGRAGGRPDGRPLILDWKGHALRSWRFQVAVLARAAKIRAELELFEGPVAVSLYFRLRRGLTVRRWMPSTKPDLDKLVRAVFDSLTGVVWRDDAQVVSVSATKVYGEPGLEVVVEECQP